MKIDIKYRAVLPSMTKQEFNDELNNHNIERHKCKCCDGEIYYSGAAIYFPKSRKGSQKLAFSGTSFLTEKIINGCIYTLNACEECFYHHYPEYRTRKKLPFNVMCDATKWAFDISDSDFSIGKNKYALSHQHFIEKYGELEGTQKWDEYKHQQAYTNTFEYKHQKYGWNRQQFDEYNSSRAVTLENLIKRWGEKLGKEKWMAYIQRQRETKSWQYMVYMYGEDKAKEINKSKLLNEQNFIRKYGEIIGIKKWNEYISKYSHLYYSKVSQEVFKKLHDILPETLTCLYATNGGEFIVEGKQNIYCLDFYIPELKVAVEFMGDIWHANPAIFKATDHYNPFNPDLIASETWEKDKKRLNELKNIFNIKTYIIWESDWQNNNIDLNLLAEQIINDKL